MKDIVKRALGKYIRTALTNGKNVRIGPVSIVPTKDPVVHGLAILWPEVEKVRRHQHQRQDADTAIHAAVELIAMWESVADNEEFYGMLCCINCFLPHPGLFEL